MFPPKTALSNRQHILCYYLNTSSQIQIARVTNIANWYFDRVIFPRQRLMFHAPPEAILEIHTTHETRHIPCQCLRVSDFLPNVNDD
ncbi:MAG: DUF1830 domain-containing protein [Cyanobacteria bacterium]|nr:DUF1830 domain-containing protein [Cyanobacteriota bacterium]MDW8200430.1 DUF1830 domain-containing protein [Cyanobacteriota bacterium SKYGB_h_bin112]